MSHIQRKNKKPKQASLTERLAVNVFPSPHLANATVGTLCVIQHLDNYWWKEEWQGSEPDVFITVVSNHRRWESLDASWDLTVYKSVCLKVNRSEEVPRPLDPQVRHDNSIYSPYPWQRQPWQMERENERADSTSDDLPAIFSWIITRLNVTVILWTLIMFKQVNKCFCWVVIMHNNA